MRLCRLLLFLLGMTFSHGQNISVGFIQNASLLASSTHLSLFNRTNCHQCLCDMYTTSTNESILSLNCFTNHSNGILCQLFTNSSYFDPNSSSMTIQPDTHSTFYFRVLPPIRHDYSTSSPFTTDASIDVSRWNATGVQVAGDTTEGHHDHQLKRPLCIYVDSNETVYVCDTGNDRIQKWLSGATNGSTVAGGHGAGVDATQLNEPRGLTFDRNGYMYVADTNNCRVQRFWPPSNNGTTVAGLAEECGNALDRLNHPTGVAVDVDFNLYIADCNNQRVIRYSPNASNGTILFTLSSGKPYGIALENGSPDRLYITDEATHTWQLWIISVSKINASLIVNASFNLPQSIIVDANRNVFIADERHHRVVVCVSASADYRDIIGGTRNLSPNLSNPTGIALDSRKNLYVTRLNNPAVFKYSFV